MRKREVVGCSRRAFTLVELLVVIAIIGILSSVALAALDSARAKARDTRRIADLGQIRTALEMYYNDHGYYPPVGCGWNCNGYYHSYSSAWNTLKSSLSPYIATLPHDPIDTSCSTWLDGCYSYSYGNVGRMPASTDGYDLTAQLEDTGNPYRCEVKHWKYYFNKTRNWCGNYSKQIYEAGPGA
jgi:prepilin-type N-terminal cleavage/methylation domain-containing protein